MSKSYSGNDAKQNKRKWVAHHLGSFVQTGTGKDATQNALKELCNMFAGGEVNDLQCTLEIDREKKCFVVRRWLDQVPLEEFLLSSISNVSSHTQILENSYLTNILTFITNVKGSATNLTEIHVFQLDDANMANYLASDIRSAIEMLLNNVAKNVPVRVLPAGDSKFLRNSDIETNIANNELASKTERNLLLLNYCFDDIEFFLQHLKDQDDAQAILKANKHKTSNRLLEGKSKPSTKPTYINCIQKIKFSLNLLSKLNGKIKNPDSRQLTIILFENLARISQAFSTYHSGKLSKIKEPLLTDDTIKLIHNSITKSLQKLWTNWGEFWTKPKEKWSGYKEIFYPEFFNGFQIDLEDLVKDGLIDELPCQPQSPTVNSEITQAILSNQPRPNSTYSESQSLDQRQEDFCRSVTLRNGKLYRVVSTFLKTKEKELSISEGEIVEIVESPLEKNWWLCANMHGERGYVPKQMIEPFNYVDMSINHNIAKSPRSPTLTKMSSLSTSDSPQSPVRRKASEKITTEKGCEEARIIHDELSRIGFKNASNGFGNARMSFARPGPVVSKKHGQLSINQDSSCEDVQKWMKYKNFSDDTIEKLKEYNGKDMFLLNRDQMNRILGSETASKLESLIKVQKSLSGFGTLSRRELEEILMKRKEKVEFEEAF